MLKVTIASAWPAIAAATTWRSLGSGKSKPASCAGSTAISVFGKTCRMISRTAQMLLRLRPRAEDCRHPLVFDPFGPDKINQRGDAKLHPQITQPRRVEDIRIKENSAGHQSS